MPFSSRATLASILLITACGGSAAPPGAQVERDTLGDTVVVRTVAALWRARARDGDRVLEPEMQIGTLEGDEDHMLGDVNGIAVGPDGVIYLYDRQRPVLRRYSATGDYLGDIGRGAG